MNKRRVQLLFLTLSLWAQVLCGSVRLSVASALPDSFEVYRSDSTIDGCLWLLDHESRLVIANSASWGKWSEPLELPVRKPRITAASCNVAVIFSFDQAFRTIDGGGHWAPIALPKSLATQGLTDIRYVRGGTLLLSAAEWTSAGGREHYPPQVSREGEVLRSAIFCSKDEGKHWIRVAYPFPDPPFGAVKIQVAENGEVFLHGSSFLFAFDLKGSAISEVGTLEDCGFRLQAVSASSGGLKSITCSSAGECFGLDPEDVLLYRKSPKHQWCTFGTLENGKSAENSFKQIGFIGNRHLVFLDLNGNLRFWNRKSLTVSTIRDSKIYHLFSQRGRLFAVGDQGILRLDFQAE
jgi:hypothetical protein